ncbi:hypothetical protein [Parachlamydia acanthamoebae]|uniref:hypothetical protein n=1 Tax=Parachlamydia acanthamoebae TaxID=83552 RepID=UPI0024E27393|nr:hypothetical protein [Parachlamydia acanthamoebae]
MLNVQNINQVCWATENVLNVLECVPGVVIFSSTFRIQAGCLQELAAVITLVVGGIGLLGSMYFYKNEESKKRYTFVIHVGTEYLLHGALNILRGYAVLVLSGCSFGMGNVFMLIPNLVKEEKFNPVFVYGSFTDSSSSFNPEFFNPIV